MRYMTTAPVVTSKQFTGNKGDMEKLLNGAFIP